MAPIRRYLRITKHSVLEVRVYSDRASDVDAWLLRRGNPALPRIIDAVKPLVLPKLREENERVKSKRKADKKGLKDRVVQDDFEVSIFLTQNNSVRHSLLTKSKTFAEQGASKARTGNLNGWLASGAQDEPVVVQEEENDEVDLSTLPEAPTTKSADIKKRKRADTEPVDIIDDDDSEQPHLDSSETSVDEKKKLAMNVAYDGFAIYGRILCLVVTRRGVKTQTATSQQMLESWVSTQAAQDAGIDDD